MIIYKIHFPCTDTKIDIYLKTPKKKKMLYKQFFQTNFGKELWDNFPERQKQFI